jgi:predicted nicotinamide N-methyase
MPVERILVGHHELVLRRPDDPEALIDVERFGVDEFMPYWAELWPSGIALARHVVALPLSGRRVLELGCGLGVPSLAAALAGGDVLATDWAPEALALLETNAAANGLRVETLVLDWRDSAPAGGPFDVVLAADVLYEARNAEPLLAMLDDAVAAGGEAIVADPGRRHAPAFFEAVAARAWSTEQRRSDELPGGAITTLRRERPGEAGVADAPEADAAPTGASGEASS